MRYSAERANPNNNPPASIARRSHARAFPHRLLPDPARETKGNHGSEGYGAGLTGSAYQKRDLRHEVGLGVGRPKLRGCEHA